MGVAENNAEKCVWNLVLLAPRLFCFRVYASTLLGCTKVK